MNELKLAAEIEFFLNGCSMDLCYPLGDGLDIPTNGELSIVNLMKTVGEINHQLVDRMRERLSSHEAYNLIIFALRMAVYSVCQKNVSYLEVSVWILFVDDDLIDWRDVLVGFSIVEDCCKRLNLSFPQIISDNLKFAVGKRKNTIVDGYMKRNDEMRSVEAMGYIADVDINGNLTYIYKLT